MSSAHTRQGCSPLPCQQRSLSRAAVPGSPAASFSGGRQPRAPGGQRHSRKEIRGSEGRQDGYPVRFCPTVAAWPWARPSGSPDSVSPSTARGRRREEPTGGCRGRAAARTGTHRALVRGDSRHRPRQHRPRGGKPRTPHQGNGTAAISENPSIHGQPQLAKNKQTEKACVSPRGSFWAQAYSVETCGRHPQRSSRPR